MTLASSAATKPYTAIPPKLVEEAASDPRALERVARAMAAVNLHNLFAKAQEDDTGISGRLALQSVLNKMGRIDQTHEQFQGNNLPMVQINFAGTSATVTMTPSKIAEPESTEIIDVEAHETPEPDAKKSKPRKTKIAEEPELDLIPVPIPPSGPQNLAPFGALPLSPDEFDELL